MPRSVSFRGFKIKICNEHPHPFDMRESPPPPRVGNNRNDHFRYFLGAGVRLIEVSAK